MAMDELLFLLYGNHPKSGKLYPEAERAIVFIRDKKTVSREELATFLNLDINVPKDKKHFYKIVSPMFDKILASERTNKTVFYHLSYDMFRLYIDGVRRKVKYYLTNETEES